MICTTPRHAIITTITTKLTIHVTQILEQSGGRIFAIILIELYVEVMPVLLAKFSLGWKASLVGFRSATLEGEGSVAIGQPRVIYKCPVPV